MGGITRREVLKFAGLTGIYSVLPKGIMAFDKSKFSPSKGKGLIFLVGDGMPLGVIRATYELITRVFGEKTTNFYSIMADPNTQVAYVATRSLTSIVTDSAPASVAWATGSKTGNRMLASLPDKRPLKTILELVKEMGISCGLVTTTRVTHATPAAWISHNINRDAEDDIALEYLNFRPDVLLGGGLRHFDQSKRHDRRDLIGAFLAEGYDVVRDKKGLIIEGILNPQRPILGLFSDSHMSFYVDRLNNNSLAQVQPSLAEMTTVALRKLSQNPKGFILQVEAGRIDHANHSNDAWGAIMDTWEMDLTLGVILKYMKANPNTLLLVTSDHGTAGFGINGTGPEYNHSTEALKTYTRIKASFEHIKREIKGKTAKELKEVFEHYTNIQITDQEAEMIYNSTDPDFVLKEGDYIYQPDATMGRILASSIYKERDKENHPIGKASIRRGNVGFTSTNHTGEDVIFLAHGNSVKSMNIKGLMDNTNIFHIMCSFFGISFNNPSMSEDEALSYIKIASAEDWKNHLNLHIA